MKSFMLIAALGSGVGGLYAAGNTLYQSHRPLHERVGKAYRESQRTADELERQMESLAKRIQETKTVWDAPQAFPIAGEWDRVQDLHKYLELAIEHGRKFAKEEKEYRLLIQRWTEQSRTTKQYFAEAAKDFQAQADAARFQETKDFYLSVSKWFGAAAAVYQAQASYTIPVNVDEQIERLHEIVDALSLFQSYLVDGGEGYFFDDPEGLVHKLEAFQKAVATVKVTLDGWTTEIREQLDKQPKSLPSLSPSNEHS